MCAVHCDHGCGIGAGHCVLEKLDGEGHEVYIMPPCSTFGYDYRLKVQSNDNL